MAIYSGFSHEKWWFSIVTLNYQRVPSRRSPVFLLRKKSLWHIGNANLGEVSQRWHRHHRNTPFSLTIVGSHVYCHGMPRLPGWSKRSQKGHISTSQGHVTCSTFRSLIPQILVQSPTPTPPCRNQLGENRRKMLAVLWHATRFLEIQEFRGSIEAIEYILTAQHTLKRKKLKRTKATASAVNVASGDVRRSPSKFWQNVKQTSSSDCNSFGLA